MMHMTSFYKNGEGDIQLVNELTQYVLDAQAAAQTAQTAQTAAETAATNAQSSEASAQASAAQTSADVAQTAADAAQTALDVASTTQALTDAQVASAAAAQSAADAAQSAAEAAASAAAALVSENAAAQSAIDAAASAATVPTFPAADSEGLLHNDGNGLLTWEASSFCNLIVCDDTGPISTIDLNADNTNVSGLLSVVGPNSTLQLGEQAAPTTFSYPVLKYSIDNFPHYVSKGFSERDIYGSPIAFDTIMSVPSANETTTITNIYGTVDELTAPGVPIYRGALVSSYKAYDGATPQHHSLVEVKVDGYESGAVNEYSAFSAANEVLSGNVSTNLKSRERYSANGSHGIVGCVSDNKAGSVGSTVSTYVATNADARKAEITMSYDGNTTSAMALSVVDGNITLDADYIVTSDADAIIMTDYATAAARDAQITSPTIGMACTILGSVSTYNGTDWIEKARIIHYASSALAIAGSVGDTVNLHVWDEV